jgi:hypothetical protein
MRLQLLTSVQKQSGGFPMSESDLIERLRGAAYSLPSEAPLPTDTEWTPRNVCTEAADTIERLTRERDEAMRDAERYRWAKENIWVGATGPDYSWHDWGDADIDKAIAARGEHEKEHG